MAPAFSFSRPTELQEGLRQCRAAIVSVAIISAIVNCLFLSGPLFMLEVYDRVLPSHSIPTLMALLSIVGVLYLCQSLLDMLRSRILARAGAVVSSYAARSTFRSIVTEASQGRRSAQSLEPMRDLDQIRAFLGGPCPGVLFDLPWIPFYLLICFLFHPWIGVAALGGAAVLLLLTLATDLASRKPVAQSAHQVSARATLCEDSSRNAEAVQAMGMSGRLSEQWSELNAVFIGQQMRLSDIASAFGALSKAFRMFLQSGVLGLGAYLVIEGEVTSGTIVASGILVSRALAPVELSIANWRHFVGARQSLKRLTVALRDNRRPAPLALPRPTQRLTVENLLVTAPAGDRIIVRDADFSLEAGTITAIIGPSGSGKSSLARAMVGLWQPARGSIRLDGASLRDWSPDALGCHIGYLPQDVELFTGSVAENICRFDPDARSTDIIAAAVAANVHELILTLPGGYNAQIGQGGCALSMGQRQRVALARALFGDPFFVVLDEPNSNLDAEGEAALSRAMQSVRARNGIVVVIAHRANALAACDMVMMVADGTARLLGRRDEVMQKIKVHPAHSDLAALRPSPATDPQDHATAARSEVVR